MRRRKGTGAREECVELLREVLMLQEVVAFVWGVHLNLERRIARGESLADWVASNQAFWGPIEQSPWFGAAVERAGAKAKDLGREMEGQDDG